MKYMHFNSSCAYAGLANLLLAYGIDTEDKKIALEMQLPYLFHRDGNKFLAGPMLQTAPWFNLYLRPHGLEWKEQLISKAALCAKLAQTGPCMFGLFGHAVVFQCEKDHSFCFLNPKWKDEPGAETFQLREDELMAQAGKTVWVGYLSAAPKGQGTARRHLQRSAAVLMELQKEMEDFCRDTRTKEEQRAAMDLLFRPLLLDAVTMLDLLGEAPLRAKLLALQRACLDAVRHSSVAQLDQRISMTLLEDAVLEYRTLIQRKATALP